MVKTKLLAFIQENWQNGCFLETKEMYENTPIVGTYDFNTLEDMLDFFTNEYNDTLIRQVHNTQILSWSFVYENQ